MATFVPPAIAGIVLVDMWLFVRSLSDFSDFAVHVLVGAFLAALAGALLAAGAYGLLPEMFGRRTATEDQPPDTDAEQWFWRVPLAFVVCEVGWALASVLVGTNFESFLPSPAEKVLKYEGRTYFDLPSVEFQAWLNRRWYAELFSGLFVGWFLAWLVAGARLRARTLAITGVVLATVGAGAGLWHHMKRFERAFERAKSDPDSVQRTLAVELIAQAWPGDPRVLPALTAALDDQDEYVQLKALEALGKIGPEAREAVPKLVERARDWRNYVHADSFTAALGRMGDAGVQGLARLLTEEVSIDVTHDHFEYRVAAIKTLASLGKGARAAVPALGVALRYPGAEAAAQLLEDLGPDARPAWPDLLNSLGSSVGSKAAEIFRRAGREGIALLVRRLDDPHRGIRRTVASALVDANGLDEAQQVTVRLNLVDMSQTSGSDQEPKCVAEYRGLLKQLEPLGMKASIAVPTLLDDLLDEVLSPDYHPPSRLNPYIIPALRPLAAAALPALAAVYGEKQLVGSDREKFLELVENAFGPVEASLSERDKLIVELLRLGVPDEDRIEKYRRLLGRLRALGPEGAPAIPVLLANSWFGGARKAVPEIRQSIVSVGPAAVPILQRALESYIKWDTDDVKALAREALKELGAAPAQPTEAAKTGPG
jgi:hypothetical protein